MLTSTPRLAILFVCAIVLPTMVLAYLGLQATQDDGHRLAAEQQRLAALCRRHFDQMVDSGLEALRQVPDVRRMPPRRVHPTCAPPRNSCKT